MRVVEIFNSIDGEGIRAGKLATFIRLAGCNLHCSYCDTGYAQDMHKGEELSCTEILHEVEQYHCKNITLTGGEPLLQGNKAIALVQLLCSHGYEVNIETNGSIDIASLADIRGTIITMDYKCPSSGQEKKMLVGNLVKLRRQDVLKFVMAEEDMPCVRHILSCFEIAAQVFLSPVFGKVDPEQLVRFLKNLNDENLASKVRVQLQLHKYIWDPMKRGV